MLILARRLDQKTVLRLPDGREIIVVVTEIGEGKVRLGFVADPDIAIVRDDAIRTEARQRVLEETAK